MIALRPRDIRLIDVLDGRTGLRLDEVVWRVSREGRDPTECGSAGGRWDDATFNVVYTSRSRDGALAEMFFHLSAGQPVVPSKLRFSLFEIAVKLENVLDLSDPVVLEELGIKMSSYGRLSYIDRTGEYPRTQEIAEVAHFHGFDGLLVPSARSAALNIVAFCSDDPSQCEVVLDHGLITWPSR